MIVQAALTVLNREGLANLTLRRVASELNVQAPALYWHVKDKTELVDYMAEAILQASFHEIVPRHDDEEWQDWLVSVMKQLRRAMWLYRDGGRVVTGAHLAPTFTLVKLFDVCIQSLVSSGVSVEKAGRIISAVTHFVFGRVIEEQSGSSPEQYAVINLDDLFGDYPFFLQSVEKRKGKDEFEIVLRGIVNGLATH